MIVIPAIDIKEGQCVRLKRGDMNQADVYGNDALAVAQRWADSGAKRLHMVDLDGAFAAKPMNQDIIFRVKQALPNLPLQVGGGIRDEQTLSTYFDAGIDWCIMGTKAIESFDFLEYIADKYPQKIILGIDARNGMVATDGWAEVSNISAIELAMKCSKLPLAAIVYTDISRDGMLSGVNVDATHAIAKATTCGVIASGGVKNLEDIKLLAPHYKDGIIGAIAGRAIYTGDLDLFEAQQLADQLC